jgi:cytochrome P450
MCQAVSDEIRDAQAKAADPSEGIVVNFASWLNRTTLDIIGIAGLGVDFGAVQNPDSELNVSYRSVFSPSKQARMLMLLGAFLPQWIVRRIPIKRNADIAAAASNIRNVSRKLIAEKKEKMDAKEAITGDKDILSVALESGGFTVEDLVDQTMTFLAAGHETTATATQWALLELSRNPDMQRRLREEIRAKLPSLDDEEAMTSEQVDQLPYLHAVCNEVLRFWSPVALTRRVAVRDVTVLGQVIPKGTDVILCPYAVNFSKQLWGEDALEFNPERWMGEKKANNGGVDSVYANMTFLHGPRSCIGQGFAKAEFNCLLAAVVGRFEMELEPKDRVVGMETGIVTRPKGGLQLRMKVVEGW